LWIGDLQVKIVYQLSHFGLLDNFFPQIRNRYTDAVKCQRLKLVVAFELVVHRRHGDVSRARTIHPERAASQNLPMAQYDTYWTHTPADSCVSFALHFMIFCSQYVHNMVADSDKEDNRQKSFQQNTNLTQSTYTRLCQQLLDNARDAVNENNYCYLLLIQRKIQKT